MRGHLDMGRVQSVTQNSSDGQEDGPMARVQDAFARERVTTFELFFDLVYVFTLTRSPPSWPTNTPPPASCTACSTATKYA